MHSRPAWLRERLRRVGINSISAIVDVTNYVMTELGQPMHAYDLAKLNQGITVRAAKAEGAHHPARRQGIRTRSGILGHRRCQRRDRPGRHHGRASHRDFRCDDRCAAGVGAFRAGRDRGTRAALGTVHRCCAALRARRRSDLAGSSPSSARRVADGLRRRRARTGASDARSIERRVLEAGTWVGLRRERVTRLLGAAVPDDEVACGHAGDQRAGRDHGRGLAGAEAAASVRYTASRRI